MTDRQRVYRKVLKTLREQLRIFHQGHVVTLAMMITGIVRSGKAQLSKMSTEIPMAAQDQSKEPIFFPRRWGT